MSDLIRRIDALNMDATARTLYAEEGDGMSQLKRCPFCGGAAEFYRTPVKSNGGWCDSVVVRCKECEARTNRILYDARKHQNDSEYEEAAEAWNNRKPVENVLNRLEEAKNSEVKVYGGRCDGKTFAAGYVEGIREAINIITQELGGTK